jgi:hypothetical protein
MANELNISGTVRFTKAGVDEVYTFTDQVDISGTALVRQVLFIGTAEESIPMGDVSSPGYVVACNLDSTNFVQLGTSTGSYSIKLGPGMRAVFPINGTSLFAKANTAQCSVLFFVLPT